ncbi:MAG TPA: HEAT repeat domain-containing protein, partial [Planctomycetes bacterium]|nr:HEAT repeat domain-containing protein [Planctomycetota bacterium]
FYFDQKERWERWMKGVGLDAGSAADALLQQAAPDQDKEIRLAAIRSLGTLGVAETLPLLIRFMQEKDEDIARAAREAVERINARPVKTEKAPAKK